MPQSNWKILGHEWAAQLLKEHIAQNQTRHAYLITGPAGVGRRTLAIRFAQALNCLRPPDPGEPCLTCRSCKQFERMQHPDLSLVQAEQEGGILKVEQIREFQHKIALAPYESRYRVALLLRFEEANLSAANALLKTLEEPPRQVILLLTASSPEVLLPTIVSRCEVLRLRPLSLTQAQQSLQDRWHLKEDEARLLAHVSSGRLGYALQLHDHPDRLEQRRTWLNDHARLLEADRVSRFAYAENLAKAKDKDNIRQALQIWQSLWRDVLVRAAGASPAISNLDWSDEVDALAGHFGLQTAHFAVAALDRALDLIDKNVNTRLVCEILMLDLPRK